MPRISSKANAMPTTEVMSTTGSTSSSSGTSVLVAKVVALDDPRPHSTFWKSVRIKCDRIYYRLNTSGEVKITWVTACVGKLTPSFSIQLLIASDAGQNQTDHVHFVFASHVASPFRAVRESEICH